MNSNEYKKHFKKYEKFIATTSHMWKALFGEEANDATPAEYSPEA
jgi:hypothetical protein